MLKIISTDEHKNKKEHTFKTQQVQIGRDELNNNLVLEDDWISQKHLLIVVREDKIFIKDLNSSNGTFVNNKKIKTEEFEIKRGNIIKIGRTILDISLIKDEKTAVEEEKEKTEKESAALEEAKESPSLLKTVSNTLKKLTGLKTISDILTRGVAETEEKDLKQVKQDLVTEIKNIENDVQNTKKFFERYLALNKAAQTINSCLDLKVQLNRILEEAMTLIDAKEGFLILFDKINKKTHIEAEIQHGYMKDYKPFFSKDVINQVVSRGKPIILGEAYSSKEFAQSKSIMSYQIASILCVPIRFADEILGVIYLDDKKNLNKFNQQDLDLLLAFSSHCAVAIKNARLLELVRKDERKLMNLQRFLPRNFAMQVMDSSICINLGGEKRDCTVMFSDIRGFSPIAEKLTPHDIVKMLNEYFSEMVKIIFKHQGTLDKFLGDGIMAIFGAPITIGNDASDAVTSAIEMQEAVRSLNLRKIDEDRPTFEIGIGIDSGEVVAGNIGAEERMEYTVIGNTVNISSRLVAICEPGKILLSESTRNKIGNAEKNFSLKPTGEKILRGLSQSVNTFEVEYTLI